MRGFLLLIGGLLFSASAPARAQEKYPLRLHVLAIDDTHRTVRLQPSWCSSALPTLTADASSPGAGNDPCGSSSASLSFGGDDDFSGAGRADLIIPPGDGAQALSFTYEGCSRVRVPPGFAGLPARWKKPGKLEVLFPNDAFSSRGGSDPVRRCTVTATLHPFVYLRLQTGAILEVSEDAFQHKPALRTFLSGGTESLQTRATVSVKQLKQHQ